MLQRLNELVRRFVPTLRQTRKPRTSGAFSFGGEGDLDESPRFDRSAGSRSTRAQRVRRTRPRDGPRNPSFSAMIKPRTSGAFSFGGEGDLDESPRFDRSAGRRSARAQRVRRRRPRDGPSLSLLLREFEIIAERWRQHQKGQGDTGGSKP